MKSKLQLNIPYWKVYRYKYFFENIKYRHHSNVPCLRYVFLGDRRLCGWKPNDIAEQLDTISITLKQNERHNISNYRKLNYFFNNLLSLTTTKISRVCIISLLWGETASIAESVSKAWHHHELDTAKSGCHEYIAWIMWRIRLGGKYIFVNVLIKASMPAIKIVVTIPGIKFTIISWKGL